MIAAIVAALAAAVLVGTPPGRLQRRLERREPAALKRRRLPTWLPAPALGLVLLGATFGPTAALLALSAGVAAATVVWLWLAHRRRRRVAAAADDCAQAARVLAALLRSGQIPTAALREAAADCPVLRPAAVASSLGADVAATLLANSGLPGRGGLRSVAAAWRVAESSGAPVADTLSLVADNLRQQRQLRAVVESELAAARASGNIMAALPFLAVGLGFAAGTNPVEFLLGDVLGQTLLLIGVTLTSAGVLWIDRLAQSRETP